MSVDGVTWRVAQTFSLRRIRRVQFLTLDDHLVSCSGAISSRCDRATRTSSLRYLSRRFVLQQNDIGAQHIGGQKLLRQSNLVLLSIEERSSRVGSLPTM